MINKNNDNEVENDNKPKEMVEKIRTSKTR